MNLADLNKAVDSDPGLSEDEKQYLSKSDVQQDISKFLAGGAGAALGVIVAKYLRLSRAVQMLLGVLGYGAGRAVYNAVINRNKPYKEHNGTYEIDSKRF